MTDKIYLGRINIDNTVCAIYLTKHSWACDWYWSFGYIGNNNYHSHFNYEFLKNGLVVPIGCLLNQSEWYSLCEYMKTAYSLAETYEIYHRGGSHITYIDTLAFLKESSQSDKLKKDLESVLNRCWSWLESLNLDSRNNIQ